MQIFSLFNSLLFHPERLVFHLERHERLYMGLFDLKKGNDLKRLIFYPEVHERLFMGLFDLKKTQVKKKCKFFSKTMD